MWGNLLTSWEQVRFSRTLHHGVCNVLTTCSLHVVTQMSPLCLTHCRLNGGDDDDDDDDVPSEKGERISRGLIVSDGT